MPLHKRPVISCNDLFMQYRSLWHLGEKDYFDGLNEIWRALATRTDDSGVGFHVGSSCDPFETPLSGVLLTSPNAWEGLRRSFQILRHMKVKAQLGFHETPQQVSVTVEYQLPAPPPSHDAEFRMALLLNLVRRLNGDALDPLALEFHAPAPSHAAEIEQYFRCPVRYAQPVTRLIFDRAQLERPFSSDPGFYSRLGEKIEQACSVLTDASEAAIRVRGLVMQSLGEGYGGMKSLAPRLGISSRTLQRKLQQEGTSYQALLDMSRKRLCLSYMREPKRTLEEIAVLLGYANMPNFHRAFKRWFGVPPARFRRRMRSPTVFEGRLMAMAGFRPSTEMGRPQ